MTTDIFWQVCVTDRKPVKPFYEGEGLDGLMDALRNVVAHEQEHTPEGYIPSGNVAIYWNEIVLNEDES